MLDETKDADNTMSFGIAVEGFPVSGASAIGERSNSWGLKNYRAAGTQSEVAYHSIYLPQ